MEFDAFLIENAQLQPVAVATSSKEADDTLCIWGQTTVRCVDLLLATHVVGSGGNTVLIMRRLHTKPAARESEQFEKISVELPTFRMNTDMPLTPRQVKVRYSKGLPAFLVTGAGYFADKASGFVRIDTRSDGEQWVRLELQTLAHSADLRPIEPIEVKLSISVPLKKTNVQDLTYWLGKPYAPQAWMYAATPP